jgi:uncharacterized protein (DUF2147 family)
MKRGTALVLSLLAVGLTVGVGMASMSAGSARSADPTAAIGTWLTESGNLEIEIAPCGEALCGTVVAVRANRSMSNPDQEMKPVDGRSPMGMTILSELVPTGNGSWDGRIYNRENGKIYDCLMTPLSATQLQIRGYKFLPLIGKSQVWTRLDEQPVTAGVLR